MIKPSEFYTLKVSTHERSILYSNNQKMKLSNSAHGSFSERVARRIINLERGDMDEFPIPQTETEEKSIVIANLGTVTIRIKDNIKYKL